MKHLAKFMTGALALGLWACSSQEPMPGGGTEATEGDVFAQLTLSLPQTRSETNTTPDNGNEPSSSTNGNEVGKDYENNVDYLWVVLASKNDNGTFSCVATSRTNAILDQSQTAPTYSVQFQSADLEKYANSGLEGNTASKPVYVFAYCNPSSDLENTLTNLATGSSFTEEIATLADGNNLPWAQKNHFTMTNALLAESSIPNYQELISKHNTKATALNLGTVKVERVVSRFDFMSTTNEGLSPNQYMIKDNVSGLDMAIIEINGLSLFNEAKQFYYLPRVSANEDWATPSLCGYELVNNWVVSPNYGKKIAFDGTDYSTVADDYFFNLNTLPGELNYDLISSFSEKDNDDWTNAAGTDYRKWRYATENTMPTTAMKHGITTGVAFRGEIKALSDAQINAEGNTADGTHPAATLKAAMNAGATLYSFTHDSDKPENNIMLGAAKDVWMYAYTHATSTIRTQFLKAVEQGAFTVKRNNVTLTTAEEIFPAPTADNSFETIVTATSVEGISENIGILVDNQFLAYVPTAVNGENHYYLYYRYYNRHNDNGRPDVMGPMEFATVRNNIYKLKVDQVGGFGLPGDLPTPPGTNDETPEVYFKVSVQVLDWVVRVNNIIL